MRNGLRVLAFDVAAPVAALAGLVYLGAALDWPRWWVAVSAALCLLIVQGVVVDVVFFRRDGVTVGTDDDAPGLRLAVVALAAASVVAAVIVGYLRWTVPQRTAAGDEEAVVAVATGAAEASATFNPRAPDAGADRVSATTTQHGADLFRSQFDAMAKDLDAKNVTATATTVSAGVEALAPDAAVVTVVMRGTQSAPGKPLEVVALPVRVALVKQGDRWLVDGLAPVNSR